MPSSDEEIPLVERCTQYKMELIESSSNSRKMVVKKVPIIYPSSPRNSPKRDRLAKKPQIQKVIVDLPAKDASCSNKEKSNLSKNAEVEKSAEKPKRKSLDLKLKTNDISDMLNVDDGDDDIDTIELSDEEDADEQSKSKSKKKSEEKSRKTPVKDKAAVEEKSKGKSGDVTAKLDAWLARIATMPLERVDNKPSRCWENSAKKEAWVAHIESNSDSELSSTSIKMKITRKAEVRGSGYESPVAGTPRKTASSTSKSVKRKLYRIDETTDGAVFDIETPIAETPQKEISASDSVTKSARRKLYTIGQTPEEKRRLLFHQLPSKEGCPVHVTSHHNQLDTSSPRGSPRVKQCNLAKIPKPCIVEEVHGEDSEDDSSVVLSSRKQTTSNNDITKSAKRKLYNVDKVENDKYRQIKKPVVVVEDCMSKVKTRQSSVVKSSNVNKAKSSSTRGGSSPSKQAASKTEHNSGNESRRTPASSKRNSKKAVTSESESDDESGSDSSWTPGDIQIRRSGRKRKLVKIGTYDSESSSDASDSAKSSSRLRRRQKRESISSDEEELRRTRSSQRSSSNVTVKDRKQDSGLKERLLPSNESIQGSGSEVSSAFRRVTLARQSSLVRHSPRDKKDIRYNEKNSESDSDPSESSRSLQHTSRVDLQKSLKLDRGKENLPQDGDSRRGCVNEVLATLRKNMAEKMASPTRHSSRTKETPKHSPSSRRDASENSDSTVRRSARENKRIHYNLHKDENVSDSDDTTKSQDDQRRRHEFSSSDGGDELKAFSTLNSKNLTESEKSPRNTESNKKSSSGVSTPSKATTSNYDSPARSSRRGRKTVMISESDSSDGEDIVKNLRSKINQNFESAVRCSAREKKSIDYNLDKNESVSDSKSRDNKKRGHEFSSSDGGDELAAVSKKASSRPNSKNHVGNEKSLRNKESNKKSSSGVSTPSKATTSRYGSPAKSSHHDRKTVKTSESDSSDSEDKSKNFKSPNPSLRLNNDSVDSTSSPARQSTRKRKPPKRFVDEDEEEGSNSFSAGSSKSVRAPSAKGSETEELLRLRKIVGEKLTSLIQQSLPRNADTESTKSPGKRKPAVSSSNDEEIAVSRISQSKTKGTPSSKRELSELNHNATPRQKAPRNKENGEITTDSKTPSKNYQSPVRHSARERNPAKSDSSDNENNTSVSRTKTQKTPDVKQRLNSGVTTPSSRSTRKRKPPKRYSDDDEEEGTNSSSVVSPRRVRTPQAKRLQADIYASPARRLSQKQTPAKRTSDDSDTDMFVSKTESPRTPRAGNLTPLNRKSLARRGLLTPTMPARDRTVSTPNTPQQEAMSRLHVSAVPKTLPCREKEFADIFRFIEGKILDKAGGCMYISGTPGTGKTATVREVMESLRQAVVRKDLPDFQFIEMNAMALTEPRQAYVFILKALTGEKATAEQAQRTLEKMFTRSVKRKANKSIVLMVDELDILWTRREDVVYNLLDWPTKVGSRFIVLTIANTMDMPERMLKGRVTSRLGLTRLTFQPYTFRQLEQIVQSRLEGIQAFDSDAVQLVARKVASVSGDARRALDICRRATELAELDGPDVLVSISHVDVAVREMLSSSKLQALRACSEIELLFLKAVMTEVERTGIEETRFFKVYRMLGALCVLDGLEAPNVSLAMKACNSLGSMRLLLTEHSRSDIQQRLLLNVNPEDVRYTLKEMGG